MASYRTDSVPTNASEKGDPADGAPNVGVDAYGSAADAGRAAFTNEMAHKKRTVSTVLFLKNGSFTSNLLIREY